MVVITGSLMDQANDMPHQPTHTARSVHQVRAEETAAVADCFIAARPGANPLVAEAYRQLALQTDRQFAALTAPAGPYRMTVVSTSVATPYSDASELTESVLATRTLEVTSRADRPHPLLGGKAGSAYYRFRAVHDLVGHVATGYGFDADGEYSAWLVQRSRYTGLARWAAATELHGEISALWMTGEFTEHKAMLLEPRLLGRSP